MSTKYKTIITHAGAEKFAAATLPGGKKVNITAMAIGDGGGSLPEPNAGQTKLINEVWRHTLNKISQDNKRKNYIVAELVIPPEVGGFWSREMGLYDDTGTLVAVANMAESYKPELAEGSGRAQTVRMVIVVSDLESVELSIDGSVVMATKDYVDDLLTEHEKSRRHPDASLTEKGFTRLNSAVDSEDETTAATPKAVKKAYDLANGKYTAQDATLNQKGLVQLSSTIDNDEMKAATPKALNTIKITADAAVKTVNGRKPGGDGNVTLGTAANVDVQTSRDDVTPGRVITNGGAIATGSFIASGEPGGHTTDANSLPVNSVSFVYASAINSPGFEASVMDYAGLGGNEYRTQLAASYSQPGKYRFRTKNGDNKTWSSWTDILTSVGGSFNSTFKFGRIETLPQEQNPAALFSQTGDSGTIVSGAEFNWYRDKLTTGITRGGSDTASGYAIKLNGSNLFSVSSTGNVGAVGNVISGGSIIGLQGDERKHFAIMNSDGSARAYFWKDKGADGVHVSNGVEGGGDYIFGKDGHFYSPNAVNAGSAILGSNGDVSGPLWGGWISSWLTTQFASAKNLAQDAWNKANDAQINSVRASRRGPQQYINPGENGIWNGFEVPNGYFSGTRNHTNDGNAKFNEYWYRVQQIYIQSQGWVDTGTA